MKKFLVAVVLLGMTSMASAATLSDVSGSVSVNKGEGFVPVIGSVDLGVGDKVLVGEGGLASVSYDKCTVSLDKPTLHSVSKVAPCDAAVITPVADLDAAPLAAGLPLPLLLLGGAVAVGGGYLLVTQVLDDNDSGCASAPCP